MSLKQKTVKGLIWSLTSQGGKQISQFVITIVLSRLLAPTDFGLIGMALVFTEFASIFNEMGIGSALIQKQDIDERHLSSAFWLNVLIGIALALLFIILSPWIALFYGQPELHPILVLLSLNFILASFTVIQQSVLTKEMNFKALMIRDIAAAVVSGICGITLAFNGYGVWSLVGQLLIFTLVNGILLWGLSPWRPKFIVSFAAIRDIFRFSAHLTGFNVLNYFARNVDYLLIGKFLGAEALGFYTLAYKLMMYPIQNISWAVSRVLFPVFSKIQSDLDRVRVNYLKMVKAISLVTFPMMLALFVAAPEFVSALFGPKWQPAIGLIRILCFCGMIQSITTVSGSIFLSQGRVDILFKMALVTTVTVTAFIALGLQWALPGVARLYLLHTIIVSHVSLYILTRVIRLKFTTLYFALGSALLRGLAFSLLLAALKFLFHANTLFPLAMLILVCGAGYFFMARKMLVEQGLVLARASA